MSSTAHLWGTHHGRAAINRRQAEGCTGVLSCCPLPLWRHLLQDTGVFHEKVEKPDMQQMMMTNPDMMQVGGWEDGSTGWVDGVFCASALRSTVGDLCIYFVEYRMVREGGSPLQPCDAARHLDAALRHGPVCAAVRLPLPGCLCPATCTQGMMKQQLGGLVPQVQSRATDWLCSSRALRQWGDSMAVWACGDRRAPIADTRRTADESPDSQASLPPCLPSPCRSWPWAPWSTSSFQVSSWARRPLRCRPSSASCSR